jgi:hypothetical protein
VSDEGAVARVGEGDGAGVSQTSLGLPLRRLGLLDQVVWNFDNRDMRVVSLGEALRIGFDGGNREDRLRMVRMKVSRVRMKVGRVQMKVDLGRMEERIQVMQMMLSVINALD